METNYAYDFNQYMIPRKEEPLPLFPPRTAIPRPFSQETEIFDDDNRYNYDSPIQSVASFDTGSISTATTPDNVTTPDSTGLTAFDFHIDEKNIRGPSGPHLFQTISESDADPYYNGASKISPWRRDTPVPDIKVEPIHPGYDARPHSPHAVQTQASKQNYNSHPHNIRQSDPAPRHEWGSGLSQGSPADWSPKEVVQWMQSLSFEEEITKSFFENDISGSILLELQSNDLKELGIMSFGKRHKVMGSIQTLQAASLASSSKASSTATRSSRSSSVSDMPSTARTSANMSNLTYQSCQSTDEENIVGNTLRRRQRSKPDVIKYRDVRPDDSVSIVAIEQLLPKMHQCSKGESCRKWQKQQAQIARMAGDLPVEFIKGRGIVTGDPGNPLTAPNLLKSPTLLRSSDQSEFTSSIVASSDTMGPHRPFLAAKLSQEQLKSMPPRDPQENVRNFLNFQSLNKLQTANYPASPPAGILFSPEDDSLDSAKVTPTLAENLRHLPRLHIPSMHNNSDDGSILSESLSAQKTVTPSILSRRNQLYSRDGIQAVSGGRQVQSYSVASPADYYRNDPYYRQETPSSEVDAPITAIPADQIPRVESQSVPPNMRFRDHGPTSPEVISRLESKHRRLPSIQGPAALNPLHPLKEGKIMTPIETPEDLMNTPRAPHCRAQNLKLIDDATHSGWMKKRKTTRLIRHEWENHYFTLKGTQLAMQNNTDETPNESKALEYIDVDDYAVACSSLASSSKLTAAFKKTVLKRSDVPGDSAFSFSLIPTPNYTGGVIDRKTLFLTNGKSHHFAVKTRDERIDWMRELMLAKALKRGRETGAIVNINGNMI